MLQIKIESMNGRMDTRTDRCRLEYYTISSHREPTA